MKDIKNATARNAKHSNVAGASTGTKSVESPATGRHAPAQGAAAKRKQGATLSNVLTFIEHATPRQMRIITNVINVRDLGVGLGSFSFADIPLANVLRFAGSANSRECCLLNEVLNHRRAAVCPAQKEVHVG